jgi:hypothetical protein
MYRHRVIGGPWILIRSRPRNLAFVQLPVAGVGGIRTPTRTSVQRLSELHSAAPRSEFRPAHCDAGLTTYPAVALYAELAPYPER